MAVDDEPQRASRQAASPSTRAAVKGSAPALVRRRRGPLDRARARARRGCVELDRARARARARRSRARPRPARPRRLVAAPARCRTWSRFADRLGLVLEREAAAPAVVVGHSLGCVVALRLAMRRPDLVRGLVLVSAAGIGSSTRRARQALWLTSLVRPGRLLAPHRKRIARSDRLRALVWGNWATPDGTAVSPLATEGLLEGTAFHTDTASAAMALAADDPRTRPRAGALPEHAGLGRSRPAGADRRRVRVRAAAAARRCASSRAPATCDRRAPGGLPRRDPGSFLARPACGRALRRV